MSFKKMEDNFTFTDMSLSPSLERNRAIARMEEINAIVDWSRIEGLLMRKYPVGKSAEGNAAYPPILLLKCLLLQKWFKLDSDPELETQINDRISFKKFLGLPLDAPSPDHSTFSRFRSRLTQEDMRWINSELLSQFAAHGVTIGEGIAIDARLIRSTSRPLSEERVREEREKRRESDTMGRSPRFSRDLESDWTVRGDTPFYGLKEHASVDTRYGFVLATEITPASHHDSPYLPYCVAASCHTRDPIKKVYADKGYCGKSNREFLHMNGSEDGIMRRAAPGMELTEYEKKRNRAIAKVRYIVEQYFGLTHLHHNAFRARFTRLIKNAIDALFRQLAFNLLRGTKVVRVA